MTDRFMIDCTHKNLHSIPVNTIKANQLGAGYLTGSADVKWTPADWGYIVGLGLKMVSIDQGFTGSPVPSANVRDVENGAWPADLATVKKNWTNPRPTIYAARTDMTTLVNEGWTGSIWLAWPMNHIPTKEEILKAHPEYAKADLVAVQIGTTSLYDRSVVFDSVWPDKAKEAIMINIPGWPGNWLTYSFIDTPTATVLYGQGTNGDFYYAFRLHGSTEIVGPIHVATPL